MQQEKKSTNMTARKTLLKFVTQYVKQNYNELQTLNKSVDSMIFKDLKSDELTLDWILGEVLNRIFLKSGVIIKEELTDESTIYYYQIKKHIIKVECKQGNYMNYPKHIAFVKLSTRVVTITEYVEI